MNKTAKLFMLFALLMTGTALIGKAEPKAVEAVSNTRLYIVVNQSIKDRATNYILYTGSANVSLNLLSTVDSRHTGDVFTYYTDAAITNWMTLKNSGGNSINLYNISNVGCKSTWDTITFTGTITNWDTSATYSTSVYTPPVVEEYDISLYNGETLITTQIAYENVPFNPQTAPIPNYTLEGFYTDIDLTIPYVPSVFTGDGSLYAKYIANDYTRIYIESTNTWWYNSSARIDIYFWKNGVECPSSYNAEGSWKSTQRNYSTSVLYWN